MSAFESRHSDARLERQLAREVAGELGDTERQQLADELAARGESAAMRLAELQASDDEILAEYPPAMMAARIEADLKARAERRVRDAAKNPARRWYTGLGVLGAVAVGVLLIFVVQNPNAPGPMSGVHDVDNSSGSVRIKGAEPALIVWRKVAEQAEQLAEGSAVRAGETLQLEYRAAGASYGVIYSLDGRGAVTLHFPSHPGDDTRLNKAVTALDHAYRLDDAPGFERFFFVTSQDPINVEEIEDAVRAIGAAADPRRAPLLAPRARSTSFILEKQ